MPDPDNWTAAMMLKWVLTRDQAAVFAMVDTYGAVGVFEDGTVARLAPADIHAVMTAYCTDPTFAPGEERAPAAVVRSERVIAAKDEIYRALRRGELEARARRNGAGDIETIASNQWLSLKLQSWNGHDLALPIGIEQDVLNLPRAFEDYVDGRVAADVLPTVWPDPIFAAEQIKKVWPAVERSRVHADAADATRRNAVEAAAEVPEARIADIAVPDGTAAPANVALDETVEPGRPSATPRRRRSRNPAVKDLIAEGIRMVACGGESMNSAAQIIARREWPKNKNLATSKDALADQIRRGIAAERKVPSE